MANYQLTTVFLAKFQLTVNPINTLIKNSLSKITRPRMIWISVLAITEKWLNDHDNFSAAEICPNGYQFYHVLRKNSRGGGVGVLLKKRIQVKKHTRNKFKSFEYIDILAKYSTSCVRIVTFYRPQP